MLLWLITPTDGAGTAMSAMLGILRGIVGECEYACSEECALKLYKGDEEAFKSDLAMLDDPDLANNAPTYWTEWD